MATTNRDAPMPAPGFGVRAALHRPVRWVRARQELRAARRVADRELLLSPVPPLRYAWRAEELVAPKERRELARLLRNLVHDADPRYLPAAQVYNRRAVTASAASLLEAAARLEALDRPVAPRGILLVEQLLSDPEGPLFDPGLPSELPAAAARAAAALELP
jgi:hypothetical protein